MAINYELINKGGISLGTNFELLSEKPLDSRLVVPSLDGLQNYIDSAAAYEGMIAYVSSEKKHYEVKIIDGVLSYRPFGLTEAELNDLITNATTAAMEFKGATATLPENPAKGDMYKVAGENINIKIDDVDAKLGDSIVYDGEKWFLIPSGDDIEDTWRPVEGVNNDATLKFVDGDKIVAAVAADGTIKYNHATVAAPEDVTAEGDEKTRTYITAVETDGYGHITGYKTATENVEDTNTEYTFESQVESSSVYFNVTANTEGATEETIYVDAYSKNEADGKFVAKEEGKSLVSDTEIARLAEVDNYDDEEVRGLIGDNAKAIEDLEKYVGTIPNVPGEDGNNKYADLDVIGYINKKAQETLAAASGNSSETAASVKGQLDDYIGENNTRVKAIEDDVAAIKDADNGILKQAKDYADGLAANYDEKGAAAGVKTELEAEIAKKVDKVDGYSLVSDTEIERLASVDNYDDAWLGNHEAFKVESLEGPITTLTEAVANISDRAGKISTIAASYNNGGYELGPVMSATEGVANLNIKAKTEIDAIDGRVGTINDIANSYSSGYNLGPVESTTEAIANLNTAVKADIDERVGNVADISNSYNSGYNLGPAQSTTEAIASLNITVKTEIDKKADAEETTNALNGKVDKVAGYSLVSDTEIARLASVDNYNDTEVRGFIGDNAKAIEDLEKYVGTIPASATATDIVAYVQEKTAGIATDAALEELTGRVADLETESAKHAIKTEVEGALALKADKSALEATDKTLADVKTTVDNFFADDAAINDTIDTLKEIANYIATDKEGAADITRRVGILEGKVDVDKVSEAIDADVKAAIDAEVLRANGAYDAKGAAADAQAAAEAAAAGALASARTEITAEIGTAISGEVSRADGKYEEKGVAQGIVDALKLGDTYEPIGAEGRAIAAAKTETENQVKALAGEGNTSTVKKNADDIASLFEQFQWGEF